MDFQGCPDNSVAEDRSDIPFHMRCSTYHEQFRFTIRPDKTLMSPPRLLNPTRPSPLRPRDLRRTSTSRQQSSPVTALPRIDELPPRISSLQHHRNHQSDACARPQPIRYRGEDTPKIQRASNRKMIAISTLSPPSPPSASTTPPKEPDKDDDETTIIPSPPPASPSQEPNAATTTTIALATSPSPITDLTFTQFKQNLYPILFHIGKAMYSAKVWKEANTGSGNVNVKPPTIQQAARKAEEIGWNLGWEGWKWT